MKIEIIGKSRTKIEYGENVRDLSFKTDLFCTKMTPFHFENEAKTKEKK